MIEYTQDELVKLLDILWERYTLGVDPVCKVARVCLYLLFPQDSSNYKRRDTIYVPQGCSIMYQRLSHWYIQTISVLAVFPWDSESSYVLDNYLDLRRAVFEAPIEDMPPLIQHSIYAPISYWRLSIGR